MHASAKASPPGIYCACAACSTSCRTSGRPENAPRQGA
ncbi:hypothetical protein CFT9_01473 [Pseudomonas sp. CFT9]|nr:hypothetical protein CFT9_01473 [Pseudomonas sp. CFT9]